MTGAGTEPTPEGYRQALVSLKREISKSFGWSLHDIDETDFSNLLAFVSFRPGADPNTRIIKGKTYTRATKPPSWL